jgi:salicylate 5-hydroxylase small subunit
MSLKPNVESWFEVSRLYADYSHVVDSGDWDRWVELFTEDGIYRLVPRENHERGFPLATLAFTGKGMLKDRAYGIRETLFHDPYYQRHLVGPLLIREGAEGTLDVEANYAVFRTKLSEFTTVYNVGRYLDVVKRTPEGLRFAQRICVYDSEMIPNSIIYPI